MFDWRTFWLTLLILAVVAFAFRVEWHDHIISFDMPDWSNIRVVYTPSEPTPSEVVATRQVLTSNTASLPSIASPAPQYTSVASQTWQVLSEQTGTTASALVPTGSCTLPAGGVVRALQTFQQPATLGGSPITYWLVEYLRSPTGVHQATECADLARQPVTATALADPLLYRPYP